MLDGSTSESDRWQLTPEQLRTRLSEFFPKGASTAEKTTAVEAALLTPMGQSLRSAMAR